jgi:hypothetical protein
MDKYFQKPMFNWFFKWGIVNIKVIDVYYHDCDIRPYMHCTNVSGFQKEQVEWY